jgi:hypothetical protein
MRASANGTWTRCQEAHDSQGMTASVQSPSVAPDTMRERVRGVLQRNGARGAERELGVSRTTILAIVAGAPVRAGSLALVRERFRDADGAADRTSAA